MRFRDRAHAGRELAQKLDAYQDRPGVLVLGLPRGGIPVAYEVAQHLRAPLDVFIVRKLGVPGHEELAMGAITSGDVLIVDQQLVRQLAISDAAVRSAIAAEKRELLRREARFRGGRPLPEIAGRTVILVDDGLATGATMLAAVAALRQMDADRIVVAVPVAAPDTCAEMAHEVNDIVCHVTPEPFRAVGQWYVDFSQTSDEEVNELLARAAEAAPAERAEA